MNKFPWGGEEGRQLLSRFIQQLPAILAETETGRIRATGEISIRASSIREFAAKRGFVKIPNHAISRALAAVGAKPLNFSATRKYFIEGAIQKADLVRMAQESVNQYLKQETA